MFLIIARTHLIISPRPRSRGFVCFGKARGGDSSRLDYSPDEQCSRSDKSPEPEGIRPILGRTASFLLGVVVRTHLRRHSWFFLKFASIAAGIYYEMSS